MAGEIVDTLKNEGTEQRCVLVRQFSAPGTPVPLPITSPGNLQCPLEFWIQSETTPLLPKGACFSEFLIYILGWLFDHEFYYL